jgi:hypothetical protein
MSSIFETNTSAWTKIHRRQLKAYSLPHSKGWCTLHGITKMKQKILEISWCRCMKCNGVNYVDEYSSVFKAHHWQWQSYWCCKNGWTIWWPFSFCYSIISIDQEPKYYEKLIANNQREVNKSYKCMNESNE